MQYTRLRELRERLDLSENEVASYTGISLAHYFDIEAISGNLYTTLTLAEVERLSHKLGCILPTIIIDSCPIILGKTHFSSLNILSEIEGFLHKNHMSAEAFENICGWKISDALSSPQKVFEWNLDCLRDIGTSLGVSWDRFLEGIVSAVPHDS